jgi:hypothetical protein
MPSSCAARSLFVQLVSFSFSRFFRLSCGIAWLPSVGAYSVIFSPMYAVSIDSSSLNRPSHYLGSSIDFHLYQPDCHFAQVVCGSGMKDLRVRHEELFKNIPFSRKKSLRVTAAITGAIRFPWILANSNLFALRYLKAIFAVRNRNFPILEANKQHFQQDTTIREEVEFLRRQFLRLRNNSVAYQTVEAYYLRLLSIFCPSNPPNKVIYIVNGFGTTCSGVARNYAVEPGCGPSEIVHYVKLATRNWLCAGDSLDYLLTIRSNYNGVVTKNSNDGRAVAVRRKKQEDHYRYLRINSPGMSSVTTDTNTGNVVFLLDSGDVDVSKDGKTWFHLGGPSCHFRLRQVSTVPQ